MPVKMKCSDPDCGCVEPSGCNICSPGYTGTIQVTWGNVTNGACLNCNENNGTYSVVQVGGTLSCTWQGETIWEFCSTGLSTTPKKRLIRVVMSQSGSNYLVTVTIILSNHPLGGSDDTKVYRKNYGTTKPDCSAWSGESIPFVSSTDLHCTAPASTVALTSL